MQDQNTADGAPAPAAPRGRYILTAVLDGASDVISKFMGGLGSQLPALGVDLAGAECLGPIPDDHPAQSLPVIPAPVPSSPAAGVAVDPSQEQQPAQADTQVQGSTAATSGADKGASDGAQSSSDTGESSGVSVQEQVAEPTQPTSDQQPTEQAGGETSIGDARDRTDGVVDGAVQGSVDAGTVGSVVDQGASGEGAPAVSAASDPAPSAAEITAAIDAGVKLLTLGGDTASALVLAFLGHTQARLDPAFDAPALNAALVAAVGALDTAGDSVNGDVVSQFGAYLFPESWKLPLVFDPPALVGAASSAAEPSAEATAPIGSPVEGTAVQLVDPSPHPDPASVNPNAR